MAPGIDAERRAKAAMGILAVKSKNEEGDFRIGVIVVRRLSGTVEPHFPVQITAFFHASPADAIAPPERPTMRDRAQEHVIARAGRRSAFEVGRDRIPDVLRKRQTHLVARLARDPQRARFPLDVGEPQLRHVAGTQPEAWQQQDDRAITPGAQQLRHRMPRSIGSPALPPDSAATRLKPAHSVLTG